MATALKILFFWIFKNITLTKILFFYECVRQEGSEPAGLPKGSGRSLKKRKKSNIDVMYICVSVYVSC
jgi:hypothetical protein